MSVSATEKAALLDLTQQLVAGITSLVVDPVPDPRDVLIDQLTTQVAQVTQQRDALQARIDTALPHLNSAGLALAGE